MKIGSGEQTLVLGPPGTGKTTTLLNLVSDQLEKGVDPNRIAFVSFTRKAVREARDRAGARFDVDLPFFKTMHSFAYSLRAATMISGEDMDEFGKKMGYNFSRETPEDVAVGDSDRVGDNLVRLDGFARSTMRPIEEVFRKYIKPEDGIRFNQVTQFLSAYNAFKAERGLLDYTDLLERCVDDKLRVDVDVVFIDEAQDLTPLQWALVRELFQTAHTVFIAGDDDQALYKWAGAEVETFLSLEGKKIVLGQSYRVPSAIHEVAGKIAKRIKHRFEKEWAPRKERGEVIRLNDLNQLDLIDGSWMVLARNSYSLGAVRNFMRMKGEITMNRRGETSVNPEHYRAIFAWEKLRKNLDVTVGEAQDAYKMMSVRPELIARGGKARLSEQDVTGSINMGDLRAKFGLMATEPWFEVFDRIPQEDKSYYRSLLRKGTKLDAEARVILSTIHGQKGGEADNVLILSDTSRKTAQGFRDDPDNEHRVFYVGVTRARKTLTILAPQGNDSYQL